MKELTSKERDAIVNKIRNEYRRYALESPRMFKLLPFEERYTQILKMHGNMENFLNIEVIHLEKMKAILKQKKIHAEILRSSTTDKIIEELEKSIQKYKRIDFHPKAKNELKFFYGAMSEYNDAELVCLDRIFKGTPEMKELADLILSVERVGQIRRSIPSIKITEHIQSIISSNGSNEVIERETVEIIRLTCISIYRISKTLEDILDKKLVSFNTEIKTKEDDPEIFKLRFGGLPFSYAIQKILQKNEEILTDFRMKGILSTKG
ncbi:MAG: hypothetical protein SFU98_07710 [Leptospiraceae bacterium]|nr:hypothetical protein [Leptospiraceae bacterium]